MTALATGRARGRMRDRATHHRDGSHRARRRRRRARLLAVLTVFAFAAAAASALAGLASATGPTPIGCTTTEVENAINTGGSYAFNCSGTIIFDLNGVSSGGDSRLISSHTTTLDATGHTVDIYEDFNPGHVDTFRRLLKVTGGSLTLINVNLHSGHAYGTNGSAGSGGIPFDGTPGSTGNHVASGAGGGGGTGGPGTPGDTGSSGGPGQGGTVYIGSGATLTLTGGGIYDGIARGGAGGTGGQGGAGGPGGNGGGSDSGVGGHGGDGAPGSTGGSGGLGGDGQGGGIYIASGGTVNVGGGTLFSGGYAAAGQGGNGGDGGHGGFGGGGGQGTTTTGAGGNGAIGGSGGTGGVSGHAQGGAIYNAGTLHVTDATFSGNAARGDSGGGGVGGGGANGGGGGGSASAGGNGADGGVGGIGGAGADASGASIFNAGAMTITKATFTNAYVVGAPGGGGGQGGIAGSPGCSPGTCSGGDGSYGSANGNGGAGGTGGNASFATIAGSVSGVTCADISGSHLTGGAPGGGGAGAGNGHSIQGSNGANGATGTAAPTDPTIPGCHAIVSVADASAVEPSGADGTLTFTVSLNAAQTTKDVSVDYATSDGAGATGAKVGTDYAAASGTVTIPHGQTSATIPVTIHDVGYEPDKTFTIDLSNPVNANTGTGHATGTIHGRTPLQVTIATRPGSVDIQQTPSGPKPVDVQVDVTAKNLGTTTVDHVTLPSNLTLGWHIASPASGAIPITQTAAPSPLDLGSLAPGAAKTGTYTLHDTGDGDFDIDALLTADDGGSTVKGFGRLEFKPDSQLLIFNASLGARVRSQANPSLIKAGTPFLINISLENRSYYRKIAVDGIAPELSGNAADGHVQVANVPVGNFQPAGDLSEVAPSPIVELEPRQKRDFYAIVRTGYSDPFAEGSSKGGTRADAKFSPPTVQIIPATGDPTVAAADRVVVAPGSDDFPVGIDDSTPPPPPFTFSNVVWSVGKGLIYGMWRATWGTARGIFWDLPQLAFRAVIAVPTFALNEMDHMVELWYALKDDPAAQRAYLAAVVAKVEEAYAEAPELLAKVKNLPGTVNGAVLGAMTKFANDWSAGRWDLALTDLTATSTDAVIQLAFAVGPGVLARFPKAAAVWEATKAKTFAKASGVLERAIKRIEPAAQALRQLRGTVVPGLWFTTRQLQKLYGVSAREAEWLANFTRTNKISVVLRSRAEESIAWLDRGALMKPYWIKAKNVNWADVEYLGFHEGDVGRVVLRKPPPFSHVEEKLIANGIERNSAEWLEVQKRWRQRNEELTKWLPEYKKWDRAGKAEGKWPWQENGVDPTVRADQPSLEPFKLIELKGKDGATEFIPKVFNKTLGNCATHPKPECYVSITGDIDLIAITKADGTALSDPEHVRILEEMAAGPLGIQHPESATWVEGKKEKGENQLFFFKAKFDYLNNDGHCCLAQFGPDGRTRAVRYNQFLSRFARKFSARAKLKYRIVWDGGYQVGPGQ